MNREIKFRAWDKEKNRLLDWNELLQNWCLVRDRLMLERNKRNQAYNKAWELELMQFTDLTDKLGKEIYEGDILQLILPNGDRDEIADVKWHGDGFIFNTKRDIGLSVNSFEVVGNIYENFSLYEKIQLNNPGNGG